MKKNIGFIVLSVFVVCVPLGMVFALAKAPFPDGTKLQPIPTAVQPDISGNLQRVPYSGQQEDSRGLNREDPVTADSDTAVNTEITPSMVATEKRPKYMILAMFAAVPLVFLALIFWFMRAL